jgi:hypothetical protein
MTLQRLKQGGMLGAQAYAVLGNVMSLVGGFASISCSLLMPALFYLILFWKELSRLRRAGACALLLLVHCACTEAPVMLAF